MTLDELYADHLHATGASANRRRWSDWSDAGFERRCAAIRETQRRLKSSRPAETGTSLDATLFARELRLDLETIHYRLHAFPLNQLMGVPNQTTDGMRIPFFLTTQHPLTSLRDVEAIIERVIESEAHLRQMAEAVTEGAKRGITLPAEAVKATRKVMRDSLIGIPVTTAAQHPIYARFARWAAGSVDVPASEMRRAGEQLAAALAGPFRRGYQAIDTALDTMLLHGKPSFGVWDLPDGAAFYQHCLERWAGVTEPAHVLHQLGLDEISRIRGEIGSLPSDAKDCYPDTPQGAADYIARARTLTETVFERLSSITRWRPRAALEIRAVEPSRQSGALYAEFYPASADGKQPSLYYINGGNMGRLPKSELAALTFHEGVPGHHLQLCTTQERGDLAAFRRRPFLYESYCEGWAMYAEQLGCELLADVLSPSEQLGCLTRRLWMAARVAVDTGIHALRWSRDEAIEFFRKNTFAPPQMIEQEVDRLSVWPAQATAYHVGYLAFSRLRQAHAGTRSLSAFHDRLLEVGPVPVEMLGQVISNNPAAPIPPPTHIVTTT
jgi:uncharacterized protein (DUF885 family)